MQPIVPDKKNTLQTIIFSLLIACGVVLIGAVGAWIFLSTKQSSDDGKAQEGVVNILLPESNAPQSMQIKSDLGMQLTYDAREQAGFAFYDNVTYSSSDLSEKRPYSVVRIRPLETSQATRNEITPTSPELRVTTSLDKEYWTQLQASQVYKDLSKIDQVVKQANEQRKTSKQVTASDASVLKVGDVEYRKVSYTEKNETLGVTSVKREDCYMAVQHDRPYVACIDNIRAGNFASVSQLEQVLETLSYSKPNETAFIAQKEEAKKADQTMLDGNTDEEVSASESDPIVGSMHKKSTSDNSMMTSGKMLNSSRDVRNFLKAAPSTVRVGVIYCADIQLSLPDGGVGPLLTGACVDRAATGFFISRDGLLSTAASTVDVRASDAISSYITNAPTAEQARSRLTRVLDYLVDARTLMQSDAEGILAGVEEGDQDVIEKVSGLAQLISSENITISQESYKYALGIADAPIVVAAKGDGSLDFVYSDTVHEAKLVAKNHSSEVSKAQIQKGTFLEQDIALLRPTKEGEHPALALASSSTVSKGSTLSFLGLPNYAIGSLQAGQMRSQPMLRQGEAGEVFTGAGSQKLLSINTPSHAGLQGAPVLDETAHVVGQASYANAHCPEGKCFGSTLARDFVDLRALLKDRNIVLSPSSSLSEAWTLAIDEMTKGNYLSAQHLFERVASLYPPNYLAPQLANYSKSQLGSVRDTSTINSWMKIAQVVSIAAGVILLLLVIVRLGMKVFTRPHTQTQYGQISGGQYIDPTQWQPQTLANPTSAPQPQQWNSGPYAQPPAASQSWMPDSAPSVNSQPPTQQPSDTPSPSHYDPSPRQ
jgi:hypothetical protein